MHWPFRCHSMIVRLDASDNLSLRGAIIFSFNDLSHFCEFNCKAVRVLHGDGRVGCIDIVYSDDDIKNVV